MTKIKALVVEPGSHAVKEREVERSLQSFQTLVGGYIEHLDLGRGVTAYINEDGKALELPFNELGHVIVKAALRKVGRDLLPGDYIAGPVVFVGSADEDGYDTDLPARFRAWLDPFTEREEAP